MNPAEQIVKHAEAKVINLILVDHCGRLSLLLQH